MRRWPLWLLLGLLVAALAAAAAPQQALFDRAVKELGAADYQAAEADLQQVLAASPKHPGALQNLGLVYSRTGRFAHAVDCYRRALALKPNDSKLLLNLGVAYLKDNQFSDALPVFQQLLRSPNIPAARDAGLLSLLIGGYLRQNPTADGQRAADALLNSVPPVSASAARCRIAFDNGRYEDAERQCRQTLAKDSRFPGAHRDLGKALAAEHDPGAAAELAQAVAGDPSDSEAAYYYGTALLQDGHTADAAAQLNRARSLDPAFWGSYFYLGRIEFQSGQPEKAIPVLQKAVELNPASAVAFYELGRTLMAVGQTEAAARAMDRVRELRAQELQQDTIALRKNALHKK